jgi:hypothetical protein
LIFVGLPGFLQAFDLNGKWVLDKSEITDQLPIRVRKPVEKVYPQKEKVYSIKAQDNSW